MAGMKKTVFFVIFLGLNLGLIPLMAVYGLRVCPVLHLGGFWLGCSYSAVFVGTIFAANFFLIRIDSSVNAGQVPSPSRFFKVYAGATLLAIVAAQVFFGINHINGLSRAPEILLLASLLLGLTQAYGMSWAYQGNAVNLPMTDPENMERSWLQHILRMILPLLVAFLVLGHFLFRQSLGLNAHAAPQASTDHLISDALMVSGFLMVWLAVTYSFHFMDEKLQISALLGRLHRIEHMDFSPDMLGLHSWGLWRVLDAQINHFSKAFSERSRLLKNFSRVVSENVAHEALRSDLSVKNGTVKVVTVLMSDIRGFTSLSEKMSPDQTVLLLNKYFEAMLDVISASPIVVDKFIGDGILAYVEQDSAAFPDPEQHDNQVAVQASLAMLERVGELCAELRADGLPEIAIGIGIYRGPVVMGMIGGLTKIQHTIVGDTVNRAARMESLCKDLSTPLVIGEDVLVSLDVLTRTRFQNKGPQKMKGVTEPVIVYGLM